MAFNQNIAQEYNRNKILTASPAELTLMLYDGAVKFCNIALEGIEENDINKAHTEIPPGSLGQRSFLVTLVAFVPIMSPKSSASVKLTHACLGSIS